MAILTVEERVTILEKEMAELKKGMTLVSAKEYWITKISGSFKDDPDFGEILRLGQEARKADRFEDADGDV